MQVFCKLLGACGSWVTHSFHENWASALSSWQWEEWIGFPPSKWSIPLSISSRTLHLLLTLQVTLLIEKPSLFSCQGILRWQRWKSKQQRKGTGMRKWVTIAVQDWLTSQSPFWLRLYPLHQLRSDFYCFGGTRAGTDVHTTTGSKVSVNFPPRCSCIWLGIIFLWKLFRG